MEELQSVKVKRSTVKRTKRYVIDTGETISEFIDDAINKRLEALEKSRIRFIAKNIKGKIN